MTVSPVRRPVRSEASSRGRWTGWVVVLVGIAAADRAQAQIVNTYLPALGSTAGAWQGDLLQQLVLGEYAPLGEIYGPIRFDAQAGQTFGYTNNASRFFGGHASSVVDTSASVAAHSNWGQHSAYVIGNMDNQVYPTQQIQNRTTWSIQSGATYDFGRDQLGATYSHAHQVQTPLDSGALTFQRPILYNVDTGALSYVVATHGRFSYVPQVTLTNYYFIPFLSTRDIIDPSYRDRLQATGQLMGRYTLAADTTLLLIGQGTKIRYRNTLPGLPERDSLGYAVMGGVNFGMSGPIQFRALAGYQYRHFDSSLYGKIVSPIVEAVLGWTPTRLTTVSATFTNGIEDGGFEGIVGYTARNLSVSIVHTYQRNIQVTLGGGFSQSIYPPPNPRLVGTPFAQLGNMQSYYTANAGVSWLINRHLSLTGSYAFTRANSIYGTDFAEAPSASFNVHYVNAGLKLVL